MAVHPAILSMLEKARQAGVPALSAGTPDDARKLLAQMRIVLGPGVDVGARTKLAIPTRSGSIPGLLLTPRDPAIGLVTYLHGGGWMIGAPADYEVLARTLVAQSGCALLLPDYRLAPEHPFPSGLEDCEDALLWSWQQRERLLGHALPLVVAGDSAGGNLATVAAAALRDRMDLAGQILVYPVTDADFDTNSYREYGQGDLPLSREDMRWFFGHYAPPASWADPRIAPLRSLPVRGLPPTVVVTAENDVLRDEGEAYAARLHAEGVEVLLRRCPGMTHGFIRYHHLVDVAGQAVAQLARDLRRFCEVKEIALKNETVGVSA
jgi:acetyl esterase